MRMAWHVQTLIMLSLLVAICGCKSMSQQDVAATTQPDSVAAHEALASYQPVASHDTDASTATASVEPNRSRRSGTANRRGSQSGQKRFPTQKMVGIEAGQIDGRHVTLSVIWPETNDRKKKPVILYLQRASRKIEVFPATLNQMVSTGEYVSVWANSRREDSAADSLNVSEHQLVVEWVKTHSEEYGMWPERIGLWIDEGTTTYLYTLQRETGDVQASPAFRTPRPPTHFMKVAFPPPTKFASSLTDIFTEKSALHGKMQRLNKAAAAAAGDAAREEAGDYDQMMTRNFCFVFIIESKTTQQSVVTMDVRAVANLNCRGPFFSPSLC